MINMTDEDLLQEVEEQRNLMIAVSTGGPKIDEINMDYQRRRNRIRRALSSRGIDDPNPYADLWAWYGKWSSGDLPKYRSRRIFISKLYQPLIDRLNATINSTATAVFTKPTGWAVIDRDLGEMRRLLEKAENEPQYQAVGLLCREILITLAQQVYNSDIHRPVNGVEPSKTDAKRMLEAYTAHKLAGGRNEAARRHARTALGVANDLQHRRTADFRMSAMCAEATTSVVNLIAIISGRRDPEQNDDW